MNQEPQITFLEVHAGTLTMLRGVVLMLVVLRLLSMRRSSTTP
jgi:hypothetical protein